MFHKLNRGYNQKDSPKTILQAIWRGNPFEIRDHSGNFYLINLIPGEMLMYEGHNLVHSRWVDTRRSVVGKLGGLSVVRGFNSCLCLCLFCLRPLPLNGSMQVAILSWQSLTHMYLTLHYFICYRRITICNSSH